MTNEELAQAKKMMDLGLTLKFVSNYYNTAPRTLKKRINDYEKTTN